MVKKGKDIERMMKENKPARFWYDMAIILPMLVFLIFSLVGLYTNLLAYTTTLVVGLVVSFIGYNESVKRRSSLYSKLDKIPADTAFFWSIVLMFPLLLIFPSISASHIGFLVSICEALVVAVSIFALVGVELRKEFSESDNLSLFLGLIFGVIILSIFAIAFLSAPIFTVMGLMLSYFAIWILFQLIVYTFQLLAYIEEFDVGLVFPFLRRKR